MYVYILLKHMAPAREEVKVAHVHTPGMRGKTSNNFDK